MQDVSAIFIDENLDYDYTHSRLVYHLDETPYDNVKGLTYETIIHKYRTHIELWNQRNQEKEKKGFLGRPEAAKRKNFLEFLEARLYTIDWDSMSSTPLRDLYLFGNIKNDFLSKQRKAFLDSLKFDPDGRL